MRVETKFFAFELPEAFTEQPSEDCWTAVDESARREITISSAMAKEEAEFEPILQRLAEIRLGVLRDSAGVTEAERITFGDRGDLRFATFVCRGENPVFTYCANLTHRTPVLGQRCIVTFCLYQYSDGPKKPPAIESFKDLANGICSTLEPLPRRAALARGEAAERIDPTRVYPYIVPETYLEGRSPDAPPPKTLGHGLSLAFVEDFDGAARVFFADDVAELGDPEAALATAQSNLVNALRTRKVSIAGFDGPRGLPVMIFGPEWLAASCLLLPDIHRFATQNLGEGPFCAAIPHRDALLVFRDVDAGYRKEMRALIAKNEAGAQKPLTEGLFSVGPNGIDPLSD